MSDTAVFVIRSISFLFPLPSALSILQILSCPPGFQRIFGFREVSTGQGLLSHAGGYLCPGAFLSYIAFLNIQFSRYNAAMDTVKGGFNGSCLFGEGNRLLEQPGGDMFPACFAGTFPTLQVSGLLAYCSFCLS